MTSETMSQPAAPFPRLHDLDALRAAAMLTGIVYHAALSFAADFPWMVQDVSQAQWPFVFQAWVHGFRMQLFMLVSGFFTAMLWRRKGLKALLWHRCRRVLFPCLLGLVTVVPAVTWAVSFASQRNAVSQRSGASLEPATSSIWAAIRLGDAGAVRDHLQPPGALTSLHPVFGVTPLTWAALNGQTVIASSLLDQGAAVGGRNRDGGTPLHAAAFMGHAAVADVLIRRGADVNAATDGGELPLMSAAQPFEVVEYIAGLLDLPAERTAVEEGRKLIVPQLQAAGARTAAPAGTAAGSLSAAWKWLTETPVFILVWFLWFLVWLVALFALYAVAAGRWGWHARPHWLLVSPANLVWLVPLTMVPTAMMGYNFGIGPDTAMGLIPAPHVLAYYAIFFFFGVVYYDCEDRDDRLGGGWRWLLPATILVIFPLALEFTTGAFGWRETLLPTALHRPASIILQSLYPWTMSFAAMGLFRTLLSRENRTIRYLSDSAYWLYLAHLPLCIAGQAVIRAWPLPAWIKLPAFSIALTAILLLSYHFLVRPTWIGTLLNGRRTRPAAVPPAVPPAGTPPP